MTEAQSSKQISQNVNVMETFIQEKLQTANGESYKNPSNIQANQQNQQLFEAENAGNAENIDVIKMEKSESIVIKFNKDID